MIHELIEPGEQRVTKWYHRVIVAAEHLNPEGKRGGQIEFYFEDEGPRHFHQRMSYRRWIGYLKLTELPPNYPVMQTRKA